MELPAGTFNGVIVDFPWRFSTRSPKGITPKAAGGQYQTMTIEDIRAFPLNKRLMADNSYALVWCTWPMLLQATESIQAWDLTYVTGGAWAKRSRSDNGWAFGTGYVLRCTSEPFMVLKKGNPKPMSHSVRNLMVSPVRAHSQKPDLQYEFIEKLCPGPYLELFSRGTPRDNWTLWGDETGKFDGQA